MSEEQTTPALAGAPDRLTATERRRVLLVGLAPVLAVAVVLAPVALLTGATAGDVVGAAVAYGGLLGLVAAFLAVDRLQARQCPACHTRHGRRAERCDCGYDLVQRPRYACERRHATYLGPGTCGCGAPLQRQRTARGVGSQVAVALRVGGVLLGLLVALGLVVYLLEGRL